LPGEGLEAELATLLARKAAGDYNPEAQTRVAELSEQITTLAYDADAHDSAKLLQNKLAEAQSTYQQLQQAEAAIKPLDNNLKDLALQLDNQASILVDLTNQYESAQVQLETMLVNAPDVTGLESMVYALREEQIAANRLVATTQQDIAVLDTLKVQKTQYANEKDSVKRQIQRLRLLEKACGRDGVQALLIERALPEIEDDANELLHRLTGGKMQVLFDTQRKLKSSDRVAETLDIRIGDDVGERPYENYSGGEQFRVNFAIRLALSKILTRRAGTRLQTLVIDEGFGSQDPEGQQRLIEAINVIKADFELILVITHIETMRDAFPTRIEVVKGAGGTGIVVSEG
jgi:exonuclease SbcC